VPTLVERRLTDQHRRAQVALRTRTVAEVARLWPALDLAALDRTYPALLSSVAPLVARNRKTSADLSAGYLREHRKAAGVGGTWDLVLADTVDRERLETALRVTSVVAAKRAVAAGQSTDLAMRTALVQAAGSVSRLVLDGGRDTVVETLRATGRVRYERVTGGSACGFCLMLAGRGAVYLTEDSGGFESHDHCGCTAAPVYDA
jgi:hypothetical protein